MYGGDNGRDAELPDVHIDDGVGRAVGAGAFEKDDAGLRGGGAAGTELGSGKLWDGPEELGSPGTVIKELDTRSPTFTTMSMSLLAHGQAQMWQTNGSSEVHAESVVSPVVSELEAAQGVGGNVRYYAGGN